MKVLIPYDGTPEAENALLELENAGFGTEDEFLIVITDVFLPESKDEFFKAKNERYRNLEKSGTCSYVAARRKIEEEKFLVRRIRERLSDFPLPNIKIETLPGDNLAAGEILEKAARYQADLIILGTREKKNDAAPNGYKSSLQRILSQSRCPVRLAFGAKSKSFETNTDLPKRISIVSNVPTEKQSPGTQTISEDIKQLIFDQGKNSIQIVRSAEKTEQIPKLAARRQNKSRSRIKHFATTVAAAF